jgi:hypothetical protein
MFKIKDSKGNLTYRERGEFTAHFLTAVLHLISFCAVATCVYVCVCVCVCVWILLHIAWSAHRFIEIKRILKYGTDRAYGKY